MNNKYRIVYLLVVKLWAVAVLLFLLFGRQSDQPATQPEKEAEESVAVQIIPHSDVLPDVEAVPMERDPVRDDIPLNAETQRKLWQACEETGVVYELALAVIWQETDFRNIVGDDGNSAGYMQIQQRWHSDRMKKFGVTDLMDPYSNFLVGCDYLAELAGKDRGNEWMLHAYNGGPAYANEMEKHGRVSEYARNVLDYMNSLIKEEN